MKNETTMTELTAILYNEMTTNLHRAWLEATRVRDAYHRSIPNSQWTVADSQRYSELEIAASNAYNAYMAARTGCSVVAVADEIATATNSWCD